MRILVTGAAGFIGFHTCLKLLENKKNFVFGIDDLNNYYDVRLKKSRLSILKKNRNFKFSKIDISKGKTLQNHFKKNKYKHVIHLAAQAGVRYSILKPESYVKSNLIGFFNMLECSRANKIQHLIFASTSSVYGSNEKFPLKETVNTDKPLSFYAATKKSNEVMAYSYSNIHSLNCTGLRFFTVYGPYGRPDMALFKFTKAIIEKTSINLFNKGEHYRDFTYVTDIADGIINLIKKPSKEKIPFNIFNIGNNKPKSLRTYLRIIEDYLNDKAKINLKPLQQGDVLKTHANIKKISSWSNYNPKINIEKGIKNFINWYKGFYR